MVWMEILGSLFVQLTFTVGFIMLYGGFISLCNRCFYDACGDSAFGVVRVTGYIGTPVHELSHALMCLLFGHTVHKISLFGDSRDSRTLGYVEHTYYRRNLYHQIGNFFIGISPVLAGGGVILLLVRLLTPHIYFTLRADALLLGAGLSEGGILSLLEGVFDMIGTVFAPENLTDWRWWVCILIAFPVAIHMEVSRSDILSGLRGLGAISLMVLVADVILGLLFPNALLAVTSACVSAGIFIALLMAIPAMFSLIIGGTSVVILLIRSVSRSVKNDQAQPAVNHHTVHARKRTDTSRKTKK